MRVPPLTRRSCWDNCQQERTHWFGHQGHIPLDRNTQRRIFVRTLSVAGNKYQDKQYRNLYTPRSLYKFLKFKLTVSKTKLKTTFTLTATILWYARTIHSTPDVSFLTDARFHTAVGTILWCIVITRWLTQPTTFSKFFVFHALWHIYTKCV
jgi:hypothetical protein